MQAASRASCPTGTSGVARTRSRPSLSRSATVSTPAGLPAGTTIVRRFRAKTLGSPPAGPVSAAFVLWARLADARASASAPSVGWATRARDPAMVQVTARSGFAVSRSVVTSPKAAAREAAAKTVRSPPQAGNATGSGDAPGLAARTAVSAAGSGPSRRSLPGRRRERRQPARQRRPRARRGRREAARGGAGAVVELGPRTTFCVPGSKASTPEYSTFERGSGPETVSSLCGSQAAVSIVVARRVAVERAVAIAVWGWLAAERGRRAVGCGAVGCGVRRTLVPTEP